jgi:hypothetical protein
MVWAIIRVGRPQWQTADVAGGVLLVGWLAGLLADDDRGRVVALADIDSDHDRVED